MLRKFPIVGLIFAAIALLSGLLWFFAHEYLGGFLHIFVFLFFGIEFFENIDLLYFTIIPIALVVFYASVSVLTILLWKFASDKVYNATRKVRDVFATLLVAPLVLYVVWIPLAAFFIYTREWFANHGDIPLYFVLLLVPLFFIFFSKVKLKINPTVGNTTLAIVLSAFIVNVCKFVKFIVRYGHGSFAHLTGAIEEHAYLLTFCAASFILLWLFEQMLRSEDCKLKPLSRILLSGIAVLSSITVAAACLPTLNTVAWSWRQINTLLFAIPIFALFVAYIVKVNRISCHPEACRRICGL